MLDRVSFQKLQQSIRQLGSPNVRQSTGLAWIEGTRSFVRAVDQGRQIHTLVVSERLLKPVVGQLLVRRLRRQGIPVAKVSPEQFRQLSQTPRASGIGLLVHQHWTPLDRLSVSDRFCLVAVSRVRSPGNLGTIVRTAEAAGVQGLVVLDARTDPFDPSVLRGSMGSVIATTLVRTSLPALKIWAKHHAVCVVGTSPSGQELFTTQLPARSIILLGEEREGLTAEERDSCGLSVGIPMMPGIDSINVAVAAGIILFEFRRQFLMAGSSGD